MPIGFISFFFTVILFSMKKLFSFFFSITLLLSSFVFKSEVLAQTITNDSAVMGAGYANDVYYSLNTGTVVATDASSYDIAFYTTIWSAAIITNDGRGVTLWAYPSGDTAAWNSMDTTGLSTWPPLYNGIDSWENGAFNRNSKGHPDYGWGVYNTITHDVEGDSLFVVKTLNGDFKKMWIVVKHSVENTYEFRYANLDGSNEQVVVLNCMPYVSKNFVGFNLTTGQVVDREPAKDSWDLLFTKYMGLYGGTTPYPVTGVLNNVGSVANRFYPVAPDYSDWSAQPFSTAREVIGWDWKTFDMGTFTYIVADSLIFFDSTKAGNIQKVWFTGFSGSSSGKFYFSRQVVSGTGIAEWAREALAVWPNPAAGSFSFETDEDGLLRITDLSGRDVMRLQTTTGRQTVSTAGLRAGIYLLNLESGAKRFSQRLVVR